MQAAFGRFGTLRKNIEDQRAAVQHRRLRQFFQRADLRGRKIVVKDHQRRAGIFGELPDLLGLSLSDEAVRIGGVAILEHLCLADAARRFQKRLQLIQ